MSKKAKVIMWCLLTMVVVATLVTIVKGPGFLLGIGNNFLNFLSQEIIGKDINLLK